MKNIAIVMYMGPTGLGILRSLGKQGIRAYGLDWNPDALGFYSKFCKRKLIFPNPMEDSAKFVCQLIELGKQQEHPMILMPAADYYVSLISRHAEELSGLFLFNIPKPAVLESIVDKSSQFELAKANHIPAPATFSPASIDELDAHEKSLNFPVLIKGAIADQWQTVFKEKGFVANNLEELKDYYNVTAEKQIRIVVQEIIPGPNKNHYKVCAYYSNEHKLLGIFSTQKTRQLPIDFGIGSYMTSVYDEELIMLGRKFFEGIGYTGVGSIEFKRDDRDGKFKLIELNPRFWQQNIQATVAGINFPYINYLDCLGMTVEPRLSFENGVGWLNIWADIRSFRAHRRKDGISIANWLRSVFRAKSFSSYASNDLRPFFHGLSTMFKYYLNRF